MRSRHLACTFLGLLALSVGCSSSDESVPGGGDDRCAEVIQAMAACYPDLAHEAVCTQATVDEFDRLDAGANCTAIENLGKADFFSFHGCDPGQHECGWIFCCDDYVLTWFPQGESDWDFVSSVVKFQAEAPPAELAAINDATREQLKTIVGTTFEQQVAEPGRAPVSMAVEVTRGLVEVPYDTFVQRLPAERWGVELDHYLGGELQIYEQDAQGRATRQLERMVISPLPGDWESALSNNDMTKVEVIEHRTDGATVYWRVMYSNNGSVETDVGSIDFRSYDAGSTVMTFHSAHRLNAPGGIHIANSLARIALGKMFRDFIARYQAITK